MRTKLALLLALSAVATPALAVDYIVTRTDDPALNSLSLTPCLPSGGCSLRQAVLATNKNPGADRILLSKKIYSLSLSASSSVIDGKTGPLWVTGDLQIVGAGAALTRVRWLAGLPAHTNALINQSPASASAAAPQLGLLSLTLSDGRGSSGGCVQSTGSALELRDSVIENCKATYGGAIHLHTPSLTMTRAILRGNQASISGGAIRFGLSSMVTASGVELVNNTALQDGGALFAAGNQTPIYGVNNSINVTWANQGATLFADNSAGRNGGAIALIGLAHFNAHSLAAEGLRMVLERNVAGARGGAIDLSAPYPTEFTTLRLDLRNARLSNNAAANGGAIASKGWIYIYSSEFVSNAAQAGNGGAITLDYASASFPGAAFITGSSFNQNTASTHGGAIASACQELSLSHSSLYANTAQTEGEAIAASGLTALRHITTDGHGPSNFSGPSTLYKSYNTACGAQAFVLTNSLIAGQDSCFAPSAGTIASNGGNQFGPGAGGCFQMAGLDQGHSSASVFGLSLGTFGGVKNVLGWNNDGLSRPQRNFAQSLYCTAGTVDVRGLPRNDGACDAGAFEQQP